MEDTHFLARFHDYKNLIVYKKSEIIYELTYYFCHKYLSSSDRTIDQMIQAARSGKQNIVEGRATSETSKETEIRLMNVAKASLHELLEDYEDYLKTRHKRQWEQDSIELNKMRELGKTHNDYTYYMHLAETRPPETIANMAIVLIKQTDYLLYHLIKKLGEDFLANGGFKEQMYHARKAARDQNKQ